MATRTFLSPRQSSGHVTCCVSLFILAGTHTEGEAPDPIPNSEVKPLRADGTYPARDRSRPGTTALTTYSSYCLVVIPRGKHPIPFRIRKLSPSGPMVLIPQGIGRVGSRRAYFLSAGGDYLLSQGCVRGHSSPHVWGRTGRPKADRQEGASPLLGRAPRLS